MQSLVVFDSAARHLSFTRAAKELNITQSAVSRQVSRLEQFLGRALFTRKRQRLALTPAGEKYANDIRGILGSCASATHDLMKQKGTQNITIACGAGTSTLWLAPRLPEFIKANPEISPRVIVVDDPKRLQPSEFDVGIYYTNDSQHHTGMKTQRITGEEVLAVCSPSLLKGQLITPDQLAQMTLLNRADSPALWMTWQNWFQLCGATLKPRKFITSNNYPFLVELALRGQGVLLGWSALVNELLESGELVKACQESASLGGGYYVLWPRDRMESVAAQTFKLWVFSQFKPQSADGQDHAEKSSPHA
ncbi:LysR substrate-binding domain-containing protein [Burkholderia alba]|uniref:LysR substrate-binding domain-containing protein n=1 Tax=Burkholderia alba TaxID=2683677 RepID=UPI002B05E248|nr:LysR substrate-binding domain-containing protein [Burkholderia alba]